MMTLFAKGWGGLAAHFMLLCLVLAFLHQDMPSFDFALSDRYFHAVPHGDDPHSGWLIPKTDAVSTFWLHTMVDRIEIAFGIGMLFLLAASLVSGKGKQFRYGLAAIVFCLAVTPASVAFLKHHTYRYCPSQLDRYGGPVPVEDTAGQLLANLPRPACWPAAHPAGGFALMAIAFLPGWRWRGIALGFAAGSALGWVQVARGEHFASHALATFLITLFTLHLWQLATSPWRCQKILTSA